MVSLSQVVGKQEASSAISPLVRLSILVHGIAFASASSLGSCGHYSSGCVVDGCVVSIASHFTNLSIAMLDVGQGCVEALGSIAFGSFEHIDGGFMSFIRVSGAISEGVVNEGCSYVAMVAVMTPLSQITCVEK